MTRLNVLANILIVDYYTYFKSSKVPKNRFTQKNGKSVFTCYDKNRRVKSAGLLKRLMSNSFG